MTEPTDDVNHTRPTSDRDVSIEELTREVRQMIALTAAVHRQMRRRTLLGVIVAVALGTSTITLATFSASALTSGERLHRLIDSDCEVFRVSGTIPLPANASPLAHQFVDGYRRAYENRCTHLGPLPPAPTVSVTPTSTPTAPTPTPTR